MIIFHMNLLLRR